MIRLCSPVSHASMLLTLLACLLLTNFDTKVAQAQAKGYTVKYLDAWPANPQMKFVRVEISANSGAAKDDLDFYAVVNSAGRRNGTTVFTVIPIRKGDSVATGELYVPASSGYNFTLHTELDGNLRADRSDYARHNYYDYQSSRPGIDDSTPPLVFASSEVISDESMDFAIMMGKRSVPINSSVATSDDFVALDDLESWYEATRVRIGGGKKYMNINGFTNCGVAAMSLGALPSKWFGYEGLGLLVISFDDLKLLAKKHPGKLLAIERWVAASGRLAILNCGDGFERIDEVLRLLGDESDSDFAERKCKYPKSAPKQPELVAALAEASSMAQQNDGFYYGSPPPAMDVSASALKRLKAQNGSLKDARDIAKDYIAVEFEHGQVVCLTDTASDWSRQSPQDIDAWGAFGMFLKQTSQGKREHNLLNKDTVRDFGFPELAEPPRYLFEFSILAYLVAVGPVAFFLLKRKRKLNLMFIVVPAISTVFCTSILAWAIFAEGFDTRVNQFTFTELNQRTGRQTTSTISHVYSGLTPSPYRVEGGTYGFVNLPYSGRTQRIRWTDSGEEIAGGEVRARTSHQLFTRCSNEGTGKLVFSFKGEGESETASVRNDFATAMVALVFKSDSCARNECWYCSQLEPGSVGEAEKLEISVASKLLQNEIRSRGPTTVYAAGKKYAYSSSSSSINYYGDDIASIESADISNALRKTWRLTDSQFTQLFSKNRNAYFAITRDSTNHDTAISNAKMESEIHILQGVR